MTFYSDYSRCTHCLLTQGMHSPNCPAHPDSWAEYAPHDAPTPRRPDVVKAEQYEPIGREELAELATLAAKLDLVITPFLGAYLIQRGGKNGR